MTVTRRDRPEFGTTLDPDFSASTEHEAAAHDCMIAARPFVEAHVAGRRFRSAKSAEAEVARLLAFIREYEHARLQSEQPNIDLGGYGGTASDDDAPPTTPLVSNEPLVPGESIHSGGDSYP